MSGSMNLMDSKQCPYCKTVNSVIALKCSYCLTPFKISKEVEGQSDLMNEHEPALSHTPVYNTSTVIPELVPPSVNTAYVAIQQRQSNGLGIAGFVIALCALLLSWVPILNIVLWFLGLIFSAIGMFKRPRGLAIAGLVISLFWIILIIIIIGILGMAIFASGA